MSACDKAESSPKHEPHRRSTSANAKLASYPQSRARTTNAPILESPSPEDANSSTTIVPPPSAGPAPSGQPKSASFGPARAQIRGRDWESWQQDESDKLPEDKKVVWQRPPSKVMVSSAAAKKQEIEAREGVLLTDLHPQLHKQPQPYKENSRLSLSEIQTTRLTWSPRVPSTSVKASSPTTLSPQSFATSKSSKIVCKAPPSPDLDLLPKHTSAFEYAIRLFLEEHTELENKLGLPSPTERDKLSEFEPSLLPPLRGDEVSYVSSQYAEEDEDIPEDGIPSHLKEQEVFRTRMRLIQLRTLLMRCQVIQSTIHEIEHKPWAQDPTRPVYNYYSKIRHFAYKARKLAEALESRDLQARCEYWAGRACGGTRDWQAAKKHFTQSIRLDVQNDKFASGRPRPRGLRQEEKEDVHFLLESVSVRYERWLEKTDKPRAFAQPESDRFDRPIDDCYDWLALKSPLWVPDRDRVVHIAKREFEGKCRVGRRAKYDDTMEKESIKLEETENVAPEGEEVRIGEKEMRRRVLSKAEWRYIGGGDKRREESMKLLPPVGNTKPFSNRHSKGNTPITPISSGRSYRPSQPASPEQQLNLEDELKQAGDWHSGSLTPTEMMGTPSPPLSLNMRRNRGILPIDTSEIQKRVSLGKAVLGQVVAPGNRIPGETANNNIQSESLPLSGSRQLDSPTLSNDGEGETGENWARVHNHGA